MVLYSCEGAEQAAESRWTRAEAGGGDVWRLCKDRGVENKAVSVIYGVELQ